MNEIATIKYRIVFPITGVFLKNIGNFSTLLTWKNDQKHRFLGGLFGALMTS